MPLAANPLIQVTPGLMIWTIVCFLICLFVLKRYAFAPLVDRLLDVPERESLEDEERDPEADDRPDHQAEANLDQWIRSEHQTRTYARIEPSRP